MSPGMKNEGIWRRDPATILWLYRNPSRTSGHRGDAFPYRTTAGSRGVLITCRGRSAIRCLSTAESPLNRSSRNSNREYGRPVSICLTSQQVDEFGACRKLSEDCKLFEVCPWYDHFHDVSTYAMPPSDPVKPCVEGNSCAETPQYRERS